MRKNLVLGLDIGGSGVKGAVVDVVKGEFVGDRIRIPTPSPHTPSNIISAICDIVDGFKWKGPIGCGFPGVIRSQIIETAANLGGRNFVGVNLAEEIGRACGCEAWIINDADAAGCAEINFGIGKDRNEGVLIMLTVGTGIGVSMFFKPHACAESRIRTPPHARQKHKKIRLRRENLLRRREKIPRFVLATGEPLQSISRIPPFAVLAGSHNNRRRRGFQEREILKIHKG